MNNGPASVTQVDTQSRLKPQRLQWLRASVQVPNPAISNIFILSSLATFISGFALILEWICHGNYHTGFKWIIYYGLFLMLLPLLLLMVLRITMAKSPASRGSNQIADSGKSKEPSVVQSQCTEKTQTTEETETNHCQSLAVVVASDEKQLSPKIKRAVSFPSHGKVRSCRTR